MSATRPQIFQEKTCARDRDREIERDRGRETKRDRDRERRGENRLREDFLRNGH